MPKEFLIRDREAVMKNLKKIEEENAGEQRERVNGLMAADYCDCDVDRLSVTLEFKVLPWELCLTILQVQLPLLIRAYGALLWTWM